MPCKGHDRGNELVEPLADIAVIVGIAGIELERLDVGVAVGDALPVSIAEASALALA
jgi:hypothetical protein